MPLNRKSLNILRQKARGSTLALNSKSRNTLQEKHRWRGGGGTLPYIALGTTIPNHPSTRTNSRRATAAVASNSTFRASSVSVKM